MNDSDILNYKPSFKRDEKEKTGWIVEDKQNENLNKPNLGKMEEDLDVSEQIEDYNEFKKDFEEKTKEIERKLPKLKLSESGYIAKALEELGHISVFGPLEFRELFEKKESSPGEYLIGVLEKEIESEHGNLEWEIFIEYLEIEEEIEILDHYIEELLMTIINKDNIRLETSEDLVKLEEEWKSNGEDVFLRDLLAENAYRNTLIGHPDKIHKARDVLHETKEETIKIRQEKNQVQNTLKCVEDKKNSLVIILRNIDNLILEDSEKEDATSDVLKLTTTQKEREMTIKNNILLLKQSIDIDNESKRDIKETRRNIYSKDKQIKIIDEYALVNKLYRENSLPNLHHMKTYQDNVDSKLSRAFNSSAKSMMANHLENKEKAYETYIVQNSTSQMRNNRLGYVREKHESRLYFNQLLKEYNQIKEKGVENA